MTMETDNQFDSGSPRKFRQGIFDTAHLSPVPLHLEHPYLKEKDHRGMGTKLAYAVIIMALLLACLVSFYGWLVTKRSMENLQTVNTILSEQMQKNSLLHSQTLQEANYQIEMANQQVFSANHRAEFVSATVQQLRQELTSAEQWQDYWWQRAHPKQFESLDSLKAWLAQDDSDHVIYVFGDACLNNYDCDDYASALVHNALEDGYLVSTEIVDDHMMNSTIIGNDIYLIEPQTDEVRFWGKRD